MDAVRLLCVFSCVSVLAGPATAALSIQLTHVDVSPQPVGAPVEWNAAVSGAEGTLWYRYQVRPVGGAFRTVRDYSPVPTLLWTSLEEGIFEVEVAVRVVETGEQTAASALFEATSLVRDRHAVAATGNALVFLYSAPPCRPGGRIWVQFETYDVAARQTSTQPCEPGKSRNFYLAGLRQEREYTAQHFVDYSGDFEVSEEISFQVGTIPLEIAPYNVLQPPADPNATDLILQSPLSQMHIATDLWGGVTWYHASDIQTITRLERGGTFFGLVQDPFGGPERQIVREFDLAGFTVRETNAARINEQLPALGHRPITGFHHEARRLPDGRIIVLTSIEQLMTDVQGAGEKSIIGDGLLVLDENLQVVWVWDGFDHLDVRQAALFNEVCTPAGGGCPPFSLSPQANDWTHANSVQLTPDGNFLISLRHLEWVIKVDYRNGTGSGAVLWRLGREGDFTPISDDPSPWFSHQHDAHFIDANTLLLFDNSNWRQLNEDPAAQSRVQTWRLNEATRAAELVINVPVGSYSFALGSAQKLPNGNYHANSGIIEFSRSEFVEVDSAGESVYRLGVAAQMYRAFRLTDLYTPPN